MCTKSLKDLVLLEIICSFASLSVFRLGDISQNVLSLFFILTGSLWSVTEKLAPLLFLSTMTLFL